MKHLLLLGTTVIFCAAASGSMVIDGNLGDWDSAAIINDASADNPGGVDMVRWGSQISGGYLYWFCEINQDWTNFQGQVNGKDKKIFSGLWIDADNSTSTFLNDGGINCADAGKKEWGLSHRGIDLNLELGLIGSWANGSNAGPGGEGTDDSMYNVWGANDDVGNIQAAISSGSWYISGTVMEACVLLSEVSAILQEMNDDVVIGDTMQVAVGVQATNRVSVLYGYDVGTPQTLSVPAAGVPEPATLSLLGVGAVAMLRRRCA